MSRKASLWLVALALSGCGGDSDERPIGGVAGVQTVGDPARTADGFATGAELRWLRRLTAWSAEFSDAGKRVETFESDGDRFDRVLAGDAAALAEYRDLLRPIRACPQSLRAQVGPPPTDRLRAPARNYADACGHFRRGIDLLLEAIDDQDEGLAQRARSQIVEAGKEAAMAAGALPPGEKQALPVVRRGASASRIDPRYGEAASGLVGKEIEVRCWAPRDWRRLLVEEKVFTRGRVNEQVLAFASAGGMRINLGPLICRNLDALVAGGARPADERRRYDLALALVALALVALAHESRHAAGVVAEATAECQGIQLAEEVGVRLGLERAHARELVELYWESYASLPPAYARPSAATAAPSTSSPKTRGFPSPSSHVRGQAPAMSVCASSRCQAPRHEAPRHVSTSRGGRRAPARA